MQKAGPGFFRLGTPEEPGLWPGSLLGSPALGLVLEDEAIEEFSDEFLLVDAEPADGFELESEFVVGPAHVVIEGEGIDGGAESDRKALDDVEVG